MRIVNNVLYMSTEDEEEIHKIKINSGNLGSKTRNIFITENSLIIDNDIIELNEIKNIKKSDYNPTDTISIGIYLTNLVLIWYTIFILSLTFIYYIVLFIAIMFITYIVINVFQHNISSYVEINTHNAQYLIGIVNKKDIDMLLNINES